MGQLLLFCVPPPRRRSNLRTDARSLVGAHGGVRSGVPAVAAVANVVKEIAHIPRVPPVTPRMGMVEPTGAAGDRSDSAGSIPGDLGRAGFARVHTVAKESRRRDPVGVASAYPNQDERETYATLKRIQRLATAQLITCVLPFAASITLVMPTFIAEAAAQSESAPNPVISSFIASPASLTNAGGTVQLTATVGSASFCNFKSTPTVAGLPVGCLFEWQR